MSFWERSHCWTRLWFILFVITWRYTFSSDKPYRQQSKLQRHKRATGYLHWWVELTISVVCSTRLLIILDSLFCKQQLVTMWSRFVGFVFMIKTILKCKLNADLTIFMLCSTRLLMFLDNLFCKQQLVTIRSGVCSVCFHDKNFFEM